MNGVQRFDVTSRQTVFDGHAFGENGKVGPYELLSGKAWCVIDPRNPLNADIVHLDKIPVNDSGLVEYAVDFHIYKPIDLHKGNGWLFYEYLNRGTQRGVARINNAPPVPVPMQLEDVGNGFLMDEGYSVVWTAWQGNVEPGGGRMLAEFPVARNGNEPIIGTGWEEFILDAADSIRGAQLQEVSPTQLVLTLSYPTADLQTSQATLTVRTSQGAERMQHEYVSWRYLDESRIQIDLGSGFDLDRAAIFEFIYPAKDPVVMGLGYASVRDVVAFLKSVPLDNDGVANPLWLEGSSGGLRALGFGLSQSGRVLRDFLHQGFNQDLHHGKVFDGVIPIIAGSRKAWVNAEFSQPGRYSREHEDHDYPGDQFPFAYQTLTDPLTGMTDGVLTSARATGTAPKVMHIDTDSEAWSARASLVATDCTGRDLPADPDVRLYLTTGIAHGDYPLPNAPVVRYATNPLTYGATLRALIRAMPAWVDKNIEPPASRFPSHSAGTWWSLDNFRTCFQNCTGLQAPQLINALRVQDHQQTPPLQGAQYPVSIPAVDACGNGTAGVLHPLVQAPTGTHSGWALRADGFGNGHLYSVYGSYVPFAPTVHAREAEDLRPALSDLYASKEAWRERVLEVADDLVRQRLLIPEDRMRLEKSLLTTEDFFHLI